MSARAGNLEGGRAARADEVGEHLGEAVLIARAAGVEDCTRQRLRPPRRSWPQPLRARPVVSAGLSIEETFLAATSVGAELCGVGDRLGQIAPGYQFDAIVLDHEPTDLERLSQPGAVTGVFQRGVPVVAPPRLRSGKATITLPE